MGDEYFDVVIVGAGLSGIGTAYHLQTKCPSKRFIILEGRERLGGTWDLFRYPGIRSDSDMHTLGYNFKPWLADKAIADGPAILSYVRETAAENGLDKHIRYNHMVQRARWSSRDAVWHLEVSVQGEPVSVWANMLLMCAGYYSYEGGYRPDFPGEEHFSGPIIHPQQWPEDLDYTDKRVVVIGSGATAVTLVPAIADKAAHVVMLQRSPTFMAGQPDEDKIANFLRRVLPEQTAYNITRWKNIALQQFWYRQTRRKPKETKKQMIDMVRRRMGPDYDVDTHFTPSYFPWDQRICLVPNDDLFEVLKAGSASIVTDHIERFTPAGILLKSGEELEADIIVTATGLALKVLGGITFEVDGQPVNFANTFSYKGIMYSDVPNVISTFGYVNASWTLRSDLIAEYTCRLLHEMDEVGARQCTPRLRPEEANMAARPWIEGFSSGYIQRSLHLLPKQGTHAPWVNAQNYRADKIMFLKQPIADGVLQLTRPEPVPAG